MRKAIFIAAALFLSIGTCSQTAARRAGEVPFEVKRSVLFEDGKLDEYVVTEWNSSYTYVENERRYSASGAMLEQIQFSYNDDKGWITTKITRDVEERLRNRVTYQYNPQGKLWRENLIDNKGKVVSTYEFAYDGNGHCISRIIKDRTGNKLAETVYTVDSAGRKLASETRDFSENAISSTKFSYDGSGLLVREEVVNAEGRITSSTVYIWQDGNEVSNVMRSADNSPIMSITSEYGTRGELVRKTIDNIQGASKQIIQYDYTFRRQG